MVLTKEELISSLKTEVRVLLHLVSKVEPDKLDYRPTPKQRSLLELLRYLVIMGPVHFRGVLAPSWSMETWGSAWNAEEAAAKEMNLEQMQEAIGKQPALFEELLSGCSDSDLRATIEMFGTTATRGAMIVSLVLCHYSAYRMQLFLYLKGAGREELNTLNLWVGRDNW